MSDTQEVVDSNIFFVTKEEEGIRLDKLLSIRFANKSRTYFQYLIENNSVLLNGSKVKKRITPKEGDEIEIFFLATPEISLTPENIPLDILYEDDYILAINKPKNMVVHPAPGNWTSTFVNALVFHCKNLVKEKGDVRPGIVHRLDKNTSGVLLAAKTIEAQSKLISDFSQRKIKKKYLAVCVGNPPNTTICEPIGRNPYRRQEMTVIKTGKESITKIKVVDTNGKTSLVLIDLLTGRTHQIRVHLKHINHPILGDDTYGNQKLNNFHNITSQLLHAHQIYFNHPITNQPISITAPIPDDIKIWCEKFNIRFNTHLS
jgi:23S rRNA pseudouridine1911/1915/1917 synthase